MSGEAAIGLRDKGSSTPPTLAETDAIGICLGACTITIARRQEGRLSFSQIRHEGKVDQVLRQLLVAALPAKVS
ncbi:MAG: hypothetical protein EHM79_07365, partial [Geobacter sp.]